MESVLDDVHEALDRLATAELADSGSIVELHRITQRVDAITTDAVGRWDARRDWSADGARTAAAWLATRCRVPMRSAHRRVRLAKAMRALPHAAGAWLRGDVESQHVTELAKVRNDRSEAAMARDEPFLVEQARSMRFSHFQRVVRYWFARADAAGDEDDAARQVDDRRLDVSTTFQGAVVGDFVLDPIGGAIVTNELKKIERQLFEADWRAARAALGREPLITDLQRTPKQRRADALVEMATRSATPNKKGKRPAPLFTVLVDYETMHELANGTVISPSSLLPWLDAALLERVVFDTPSRVLDVGEKRRLFDGATRRAVEVVGQECFDEHCEERAEDCEADHIQPHGWGGPTIQANGRPASGFHNRRRARGP